MRTTSTQSRALQAPAVVFCPEQKTIGIGAVVGGERGRIVKGEGCGQRDCYPNEGIEREHCAWEDAW